MEITYTQQGDYLLPNLTLPEQDSRSIGLWGQQHLRYIKRSRPILYTNLLTKCKLNEYLNRRRRCMMSLYSLLPKKKSARSNSKRPIKCFGYAREITQLRGQGKLLMQN